MTTHIFGIRHHGPGSARSLVSALRELQPDCVLVEGPPDADTLLPLMAHPAMVPPVALLIYAPETPRLAVYYPFAEFSPEYQAIRYALETAVAVRFMDLPQAYQLSVVPGQLEPDNEAAEAEQSHEQPATDSGQPAEQPGPSSLTLHPSHDPLGFLAQAAGYSDGERWWEQMVEQRRDSLGLFEAILEAMMALREQAPPEADQTELRREAWMRQTIRAAEKQGFERIAIVCGAWHGPALLDLSKPKVDAALLKGIPKAKVQATFSPWTYGRLASSSGYGAGVRSPGYYEHLWQFPEDVSTRWMARVARLLREQDLDASAAHVVEAVRLAEALAALRDRPLPGLPELNEAAQAVFTFGSDVPMRLIEQQLIVGERLGRVPDETPMVPLQADLQREQKRLRMPAEAAWRDYDFDLRKPIDLERSHLLHRLNLLNIRWGSLQRTTGAKGTFHEYWRVEWQPEFAVSLIEASMWGATVAEAATAFTRAAAEKADTLPSLTQLVDSALLADLPEVITELMRRLEDAAALASDVVQLMDALPPLADVLRYGNVRRTDAGAVGHVVDSLVARICIGLPGACASLDDDAASAMFERINNTQRALALIRNEAHDESWRVALQHVADGANTHGLVAGRCCRLLADRGSMPTDELERRLRFALSAANPPMHASAWLEGVLKGSGMLLIHHDALWQIVDSWVAGLRDEAFQQVLPLLRRTFSTFSPPERRQMGERARDGISSDNGNASMPVLNKERAEQALPLVAQLLGMKIANR